MSCPHDGTELSPYPQRDKWRCRTCVGVLVGDDELGIELALTEWPEGSETGRRARVGCPACGETMRAVELFGVELDRCAHDRYVWFDSGELGYLRAYIVESAGEQPARARRLLALLEEAPPREA